MQKFLLGLESINPYQILAADINRNNSVSASDILLLEQNIIGLKEPVYPVWIFVDQSYNITNYNLYDYPDRLIYSDSIINYNFIGIKKGDVDQSYKKTNDYEDISLNIKDKVLFQGEEYEIKLYHNTQIKSFEGLQITINYDANKLKFESVSSDVFSLYVYNIVDNYQSKIKLLYLDPLLNADIEPLSAIFKIKFKALDNGILHNVLELDSTETNLLTTKQNTKNIKLNWNNYILKNSFVYNKFDIKLYPQPASNLVKIKWDNNKYTELDYKIYNNFGQIVKENKISGNSIDISTLSNGIYFIRFYKENIQLVIKKLIVNK